MSFISAYNFFFFFGFGSHNSTKDSPIQTFKLRGAVRCIAWLGVTVNEGRRKLSATLLAFTSANPTSAILQKSLRFALAGYRQTPEEKPLSAE